MDYYVTFIEDVPPLTYGPYDLAGAKQFARIGSSYGGDRTVTRGVDGSVIRMYRQGFRYWPRGAAEIESAELQSGELPMKSTPWLPGPLRDEWKSNGGWSRTDTTQVADVLAAIIWHEELQEAAHELIMLGRAPATFGPVLMHAYGDDVPSAALVDARRVLSAVKRKHAGAHWWDMANTLRLTDVESVIRVVREIVTDEAAINSWTPARTRAAKALRAFEE